MKMSLKMHLAAAIAVVATMAAGDGFFGNSSGGTFFQAPSNPNSTWSGSKADLEAIVAQAKANYGFEDSKSLGRNATMLVPATLDEMRREIEKYDNPTRWSVEELDGAHAPDAKRDDGLVEMWKKSGKGEIIKYTNPNGGEVVYDAKTGRIVKNEKMGTHNFAGEYRWYQHPRDHINKDMNPNAETASPSNIFERDGDQYKYVGILYERDPNDPNKFYLVDGQTGKRMTRRQAEVFPTTLSDMWKEQGLMCVANDAKDYEQTPTKDYEQTPTSTINTAPALDPIPAQTVKTPSGIVNTAPAMQSYTIDNTAMKQYLSQQLEGAYQYASGIAAEAGVGAEYQSAAAPVVSQTRAAISALPDQQTYSVPAGSVQGGGYSSQTMDEFGKRFAEQGPCSAGLWLEANK